MSEEIYEKTSNPFKVGFIIALVIVLGLAGFLVYVTMDRAEMIEQLTIEKAMITRDMEELKQDYSDLSTDNDSLNLQITKEREKVDQLIERMKTTEAKNRTQIVKYQNEMKTLRNIMKSYIAQIDSLNTLNAELKADALRAREEAQRTQERLEKVSREADQYAQQVEIGSVLKSRNIEVLAINKSDKETTRSSRAVKLVSTITIIENSIAELGPRDIYLRVLDPDGILITDDLNQTFTLASEQLIYSAVRELDYQGEEIEITIYFAAPEFVKGIYTVEAYTTDGMLATGEILLK